MGQAISLVCMVLAVTYGTGKHGWIFHNYMPALAHNKAERMHLQKYKKLGFADVS